MTQIRIIYFTTSSNKQGIRVDKWSIELVMVIQPCTSLEPFSVWKIIQNIDTNGGIANGNQWTEKEITTSKMEANIKELKMLESHSFPEY